MDTREHLPISVNSLKDEARLKLRRWILTGRIQPGERIVETEVARMFGTSQGPVREALRGLEEDGLVCSIKNKGAYATEIIPREIYHTFRLRTQIECYGLEVTIPHIADVQLDSLMGIVEQMKTAIDDPEGYNRQVELDMEFHGRLLSWAGVEVYQRVWNTLELSTQRFLNIVHPSFFSRNRRRVIHQHVELVRIFQERDAARAQAAMREHIMLIWDTLGNELLQHDRLDLKDVRDVGSDLVPGGSDAPDDVWRP